MLAAAVPCMRAQADAQSQVPPAPATGGTEASNTLEPQELIEDSAKRMLTELDANRAMYAQDPAKLDSLVANVLLPHFDSDYAARLVLGQTWRTATAEQRKRFVDAFYHSLLQQLRQRVAEFHRRSVRDPALPRRSGRNNGDGAHRSEEILGRKGAGQFQSAQDRLKAGRRGTW